MGDRIIQVLVVDNDPLDCDATTTALASAGYAVLTASTGTAAIDTLCRTQGLSLIISDLALPDMSGFDILAAARRAPAPIPVMLMTREASPKAAVAAIRSGAASFLEKPIPLGDLLREVQDALRPGTTLSASFEAHALVRWARALAPLLDCPRDPRTITAWGRWVAISSGALRNWCRTAGIPARQSLVFIRMLRAVALVERSGDRLENLLDVVDRRTLRGLVRFAGFAQEDDVPKSVTDFLARQQLVRDEQALVEIRRAIQHRIRPVAS